MHKDWLTIAAAAKALGLAERQARRYAAKLADTDRTIDRTDGKRDRTLVRLAALREIAEAAQARPQPTDTDPDADRTPVRTMSETSVSLVVAYEKVIEEQKARIVDLQTALEHERHQTRSLNDALLREQQLRLLTAPIEEPTPPATDTTTGQSPDTGPPPRPNFWTRLFGPKDKQA